ncbi:MAG: hypothetical protein GY716_25720 [bacterium]|nr:hypothetical protein [bacterium]
MSATLARFRGVVALAVVLCTTACLIGRVSLVDYKYDTSALRMTAGIDAPLQTTADGTETDLIVEDGATKFLFRVFPGRIYVTIVNNDERALRLDIADATHVDSDGHRRRLFVFGQESEKQETLVISPGSTVDLSLWPEDWVRRYKGRPITGKADSPMGGKTMVEASREEALEAKKDDVGKSFEVHLPFRRDDASVDYVFRFEVSSLFATRIWWA